MAKSRKSGSKATTTRAVATVASSSAAKALPTHDQIARRAYELWLARGQEHGTHLENWLAAERELHAA